MKATIFKTASLVKSRHSGLSGIVASVPVSAPTIGCFCNALKKNDSRQAGMTNKAGMAGSRRLRTFYETVKTAKGFTIVELMITMVVFVLAIAAATSVFTGLLTQFKQQGKIAETNIEGVIGLEMLRQDIEKAGYGLPWVIPSGTTYNEAASSTPCGSANPTTYNDSTTNPPRAILTGNNLCANGSDYLVIKAANVANNDAAGKWTTIIGTTKKTWTPATENLAASDRVIAISPSSRTLSSFNTQYSSAALPAVPYDNMATGIIYGIDPNTTLRMPFNRADYFISTTNVPSQCASGTGVLEKVVVDQSNGALTNFLPLLDCVASIQVIYQLDMDDNGTIGTQSKGDGSTVVSSEGATTATVQATLASASLLRARLKEVRIYILAHEGQLDMNYTFTNFTSGTNIEVGEYGNGVSLGQTGTFLGRSVAMSGITNYSHYRWKIYTIVAKLRNLNK